MSSSDNISRSKTKTTKKKINSSSEEKTYRKKEDTTSSESSSSEEKPYRKKEDTTSSESSSSEETPPVTIKARQISSSDELSSDEEIGRHLPRDLAEIVNSYSGFSGQSDRISEDVNCVASFDKIKGIIYYISYDVHRKDYYLVKLDLSSGENQKRKLNLEKYNMEILGCNKMKNFLFIYNSKKCILLDLKRDRVIHKGKFSMRSVLLKNQVDIVAVDKKTVTVASTPASKRYNITVFEIKTGKIVLSKDVASRFPVVYLGTSPAGEIIFLTKNTLIKYY